MVGGGIQHEHVSSRGKHHFGDHTTHLFSPGEYRSALVYFLSTEEHTSEESLDIDVVGILSELPEPLYQVHIGIEEVGIIQRKIGFGNGLPPFECTRVGFAIVVDNLKKSRHGTRVAADENDLIALLYIEVEVLEKDLPFDACG